MARRRWWQAAAFGGLVGLAGGCQLLSGLSGLHGGGGGGTASTGSGGTATGGTGTTSTGTGTTSTSSTTSSGAGGALPCLATQSCELEPVAAATGVVALAADRDYVYWSETTSIRRAPGASGSLDTIVNATHATALAVDDNKLYWLESRSGFGSLSKDAVGKTFQTANLNAFTFDSDAGAVDFLAVRPPYLLWIQDTPSKIFSVDTGHATFKFAGAGLDPGGPIALDSDTVYWRDGIAAKQFNRAPISALNPVTAVWDADAGMGTDVVRAMAIEGTRLFWLTPDANGNLALKSADTVSHDFTTHPITVDVTARNIVVTSRYVFWTECPSAAASALKLYDLVTQQPAASLSVDACSTLVKNASYVYGADHANIWRLALP